LHESSSAIPLAVLLALPIVPYVRGWIHLRKTFPGVVTTGQMASFICGNIVICIAVASPLAELDHKLLTAHMVQHLLSMAVGPPLILMGKPALCMLVGVPKLFFHGGIAPFLSSSPLRRLVGIVRHPVFCWIAASMTVIEWHIPAVFLLGLHSNWWHGIQQISFLVAGFLFWWPVIRRSESAAHSAEWIVALYLFLATLPCDALSAFLTFCGTVVYPHYLSASRPFGVTALQDQEWAGVVMWVCVTFIYMIPALVLILRSLSPMAADDSRIGNHLGEPVQCEVS
jgi:putative membrane protein